ncbi:Cof-type HAD-IIB family hydrolase [Phocicoccus pinnipedialis]|uniref:Bifunctional phosphatase/peptidyl-prolyl cis-trans isomerase n=1 Tax=Phocicoccus pinnipedialis TaxID=110845 RepID=A0A6V7RCI8_9BACL|nr:Cof-type HAD-IIB family hydrolase [Jeotgalicoccus pinnipedialis]MBP1939896.1 Cof subfamily protein (haloacid dehalogenase superfamily) [Jeotgalicoccus pinnipedialis]CAD2074766.1 Putative bifunctional phosphatase/peptidyl-prolyl cis-trans isomerase [Jeotgalicoccus pinnipedialis]
MKKILFFDIDGTLLDTNKNIPESTKYAVKELKKAGHTVAIATGRAPFLFSKIREELDIDTYIACNGQYVVVDSEVIHKESIPETDIVALTNKAMTNDHPIVYIDHEDMASNMESHVHVDEGLGSLKFDQDPIHDPNYFEGREILQALLFCEEGKEDAYEEQFTNLDFLRWHPLSLDVMPSGGTKAKSVKRIQAHLGLEDKDIYAFGDGPNDYEMLQQVENSVAMKNGVEQSKSVAKLVTDHVDNDGLYKAIVKLGLIKEM